MLPDIHYTDAILTVLFSAQVGFGIWVVNRFAKLEKAMMRHDRKLRKSFRKANLKGAEIVAEAMRSLRLERRVTE